MKTFAPPAVHQPHAIVEDEEMSLAKEVRLSRPVSQSDDVVPNRGDIHQEPILDYAGTSEAASSLSAPSQSADLIPSTKDEPKQPPGHQPSQPSLPISLQEAELRNTSGQVPSLPTMTQEELSQWKGRRGRLGRKSSDRATTPSVEFKMPSNHKSLSEMIRGGMTSIVQTCSLLYELAGMNKEAVDDLRQSNVWAQELRRLHFEVRKLLKLGYWRRQVGSHKSSATGRKFLYAGHAGQTAEKRDFLATIRNLVSFRKLYTTTKEEVMKRNAALVASLATPEISTKPLTTPWILDTGSTEHCVNNLKHLTQYDDIKPTTLRTLNGPMTVTKVGRAVVTVVSPHGSEADIELNEVYFTPDAPTNIISVGLLEERNGVTSDIAHRYLTYQDKILSGIEKQGRVFILPVLTKEDPAEEEVGVSQSSPLVCMGAAQSLEKEKKRPPPKTTGATYESNFLLEAMKLQDNRFDGYPCLCRKAFQPTDSQLQEAEDDGSRLLPMEVGDEGVVFGDAQQNEAGTWFLRVGRVQRLKTIGTSAVVEEGFVPHWALTVATYYKNGDAHMFFRNAPLRQSGWRAPMRGLMSTRFGQAVDAELAEWYENSNAEGELPILERTRDGYLKPDRRKVTVEKIAQCIRDASQSMWTALNKEDVSWEDIRDAGEGPTQRPGDPEPPTWPGHDKEPIVYAIFYWDFDDGDDKVYVYVGQTNDWTRRAYEHNHPDAEHAARSNHYKVRVRAKQSKMVALALCTTMALRDIMEQLFVDLFRASCDAVLLEPDEEVPDPLEDDMEVEQVDPLDSYDVDRIEAELEESEYEGEQEAMALSLQLQQQDPGVGSSARAGKQRGQETRTEGEESEYEGEGEAIALSLAEQGRDPEVGSSAQVDEQPEQETSVEGEAQSDEPDDARAAEERELDHAQTPFTRVDVAYDRQLASRFQAAARAAADKSGWQGLAGIGGGCNWKMPLGAATGALRMVYVRQIQPNGYTEFRRPAKSFPPNEKGQPGFKKLVEMQYVEGSAADRGKKKLGKEKKKADTSKKSVKGKGKADTSKKSVKGKGKADTLKEQQARASTFSIGVKNEEFKSGAPYSIIYELSPRNQVHPYRWLTSATVGAMSDSADANRLAIRYEYCFVKDGITRLRRGYLKYADSKEIVVNTQGAFRGYIQAIALVRFLEQTTFVKGTLQPWQKNLGCARVMSAVWNHLHQTCYLDIVNRPPPVNGPTVRSRAEVDREILASLPAGSTTLAEDWPDFSPDPNRARTGGGRPRTKCDRCAEMRTKAGFKENFGVKPCVGSGEQDVQRCQECQVAGSSCLVTPNLNLLQDQDFDDYILAIRGTSWSRYHRATTFAEHQKQLVADRPDLGVQSVGD